MVDTEINRIETVVPTEVRKKGEYKKAFAQLNARRAKITEAITQAEASLDEHKDPKHAIFDRTPAKTGKD